MQEAGVNAIKLADGTQVEVKPFYGARIPESRTDEALVGFEIKVLEI